MQSSWQIDCRYDVCVVHARGPPNWIVQGIVFGLFHTFGEPIVYIPTKFRENILIGDRDMPPKQNLKRALWRRNSTSGSNCDKCHLSLNFLRMILRTFKKIAQRAAELYAIQLFLHLLLNLHCKRHNDTVPSCRPSIGARYWGVGHNQDKRLTRQHNNDWL